MGIDNQLVGLTRRFLVQIAAMGGLTRLIGAVNAAEENIGSVQAIVGEAFSEANERRRKLTARAPVFLGDTLSTGTRSRLRALLARKTRLRLGAETRVTIDRFIANVGGDLDLGSGALLLETPSGAQPTALNVQSPFALIAVRGTRFFAGDLERAFSVFVERGAVNVTAAGVTVRLRRGEGTDIARPGAAPGPVKKWGKPKIGKAMALVR